MTQIFVSYKREYADFAKRVRDRLHEWGYGTWFDLDDIKPGSYFRLEIQKGLDTSQIICGVMTQEAFASREVMAEWDYFLANGKPLVPLKFAECKPMYHIQHIQYIDFIQDESAGFAALRQALPPVETPIQASSPPPDPAEVQPISVSTVETAASPPSSPSGEVESPTPVEAALSPPATQVPVTLFPSVEVPKPSPATATGEQPVEVPVPPRRHETAPRSTTEQINRSRMLQKVDHFWIKGVLEK
jgi:hypothetical protein